MRCYQCGAEILAESRFCTYCGARQDFSQELIQQAIEGKQTAITELYERTYPNVYYTVKSLLRGDEDTVLDIVQDSYIKAFQSLKQLRDPRSFRAWIKQIAKNKSLDWLRKQKPIVFSEMTSVDSEEMLDFKDERTENLPEAVMDQKETARFIQEILNTLSDEQRVVVGLYYYEKLSVRDITQQLGCSENTVKSRLSYGRKKIEMQVRALEKRGVKLYGLAPIPFLLFLFRNTEVSAAVLPNQAILTTLIEAAQNGSMATSAAGAASAAGTAGTVAGASGAAGAASGAVAGAAGKLLAVKIIAGICIVGVVGGTTAGAVHFVSNHKETNREETAVLEERKASDMLEIPMDVKERAQEVQEELKKKEEAMEAESAAATEESIVVEGSQPQVSNPPVEESSEEEEEKRLEDYNGYSYYENEMLKYQLEMTDGFVVIHGWFRHGEPVWEEELYYLDLSSAEIDGNTYSFSTIQTEAGEDVSFQFVTLDLYLEDNTLTMYVERDPNTMAGGASGSIQTGTYIFS